jgi:endonuclease YncB( thermonuclease family)
MSRRLLGAAPLLALLPLAARAATPQPAAADREIATFAACAGGHRTTCVVDGDTFWYRGAKIRLADINAPEVSQPGCPREAELGRRATERLRALLNAGPFTLAANDDGTGRDRDRYGRLLRTVTRGGASVGEELVREGLAEPWAGRRGTWC